jgi:hypothetical protein
MKTDNTVKNNAVFSTENKGLWASGKYVVIDPCYVYGDDTKFWDEFCEFCFPTKQEHRDPVFVNRDGVRFITWSTKYGDGEYPVFDYVMVGNDGRATAMRKLVGNAGVDAGCLALIPFHKDFELKSDYENMKVEDLGVIVEVNETFMPEFKDGNGFFGNIEVITDNTDEEDCEEENEDA